MVSDGLWQQSIPWTQPLRKSPPPEKCITRLAKAVLETKPLPDMEGDPGLAIPAHSLVWLAQQKDYDATTDDPRYKASVLDCRQHSQRVMTVHSRMIQDHMAPEYEAALSSLLQTKSDEKKEN
jgi:hypothetical protein